MKTDQAGAIRPAQSASHLIAYDEWNVWYRAFNREKLEEFYDFEDAPALRYLDVSMTYNADERTIYVNVLNRSKDKDLTTRIV